MDIDATRASIARLSDAAAPLLEETLAIQRSSRWDVLRAFAFVIGLMLLCRVLLAL